MTSTSPPPARLLSPYLHLLAFVGGFNVMLLEMCGFRVLQTTFGSSIYVTGALLALVMIALTAGYYLGGRFSRRFGSLEFLLGVLLAAAGYVALVHLALSELLLDALFGLRGDLQDLLAQHVLPVTLATLVLYAPPMVALSQVSPYLIKLLARSAEAEPHGVGVTAGNLMAVSNVGSIAGTLLPSFFLIPQLGVRVTVGIFLGSLVAVAGLGLVAMRRRVATASVAAGTLLLAFGLGAQAPAARSADVAFSGESLYGTVQILRTMDEEGHALLQYMPSRTYVHSTVYADAPLKDQFTTAYVNVGLARAARRYLVLGTALGGAVAAVLAADPQAEVVAVEIDPLVVDLARRFVPALESPRVRMVVQDARVFLREDRGAYDYIVVDVFAGEHIPAHCITREFFALARARLAAGGVLQMNTNLWDFQVLSGVEQPPPFVAVHHLHAALLQAGFASIFQSDLFSNGHVYAFPQPTSLRELREQLVSQALQPSGDVHLRASWAATALTLFEVPADRRALRPFSDAWVPEHQLQMAWDIGRYLAALQRARRAPGWQAAVEDAGNDELRRITVRHYAAAAEVSPSQHGYEAYLETKGGDFCRELLAWAARHEQAPYPELARFVHTPVLHRCSEVFATLPVPAERSAAALRDYAEAMSLVNENQGDQALPLLVSLLSDRS